MTPLRIAGRGAVILAVLLPTLATSTAALATEPQRRAQPQQRQQPANAGGHRGAPAPVAPRQSYNPGYSHQNAPYRAAGYAYGPTYYRSGYYYTGWGIHPWGYWGYGYYPYYGGPVIAEQVPVSAPPITSSVMIGGMVSSNGPGVDLRLATDGSNWGGNFSFLTLPTQDPANPNDIQVAPYLSAHLTYSVLSNLHTRVRVEGGATLISAPSYTYLGPDVGVSALLEIIGPLGIDGSFHWTPVPADIVDADAGLALHFGALAIRGGWRVMRIDDARVNDQGGATIYNGPTASVGLVF